MISMIVYSVSRQTTLYFLLLWLIFPVLVSVMMNSTFLPMLYRYATATQHKIYPRAVTWGQSILSSNMQMFLDNGPVFISDAHCKSCLLKSADGGQRLWKRSSEHYVAVKLEQALVSHTCRILSSS